MSSHVPPSVAEQGGTALGRLPAMRFAAVLFDMDGTLIDSTPAVIRSWVAWAVELGIDPYQLQGLHGIPAATIASRFVPADQLPAALARITQLEVEDTKDIAVLPGAAEALAALPPGRAAIATSCTRPLADARIGATGLIAPVVVITVDDVDRGKPHPDPFLAAARELGVDPPECLVVEDAPLGLVAARAAGCATLAVSTTSPASELIADAVVRDLSAVRFTLDGDGLVRVTARPAATPA